MHINLIAAHDNRHAIGYENDLLWPPGSQKADMSRFRKLTAGHPVIMGRKTWESIPAKYRPLQGRLNIVISRNENYDLEGAPDTILCTSVQQAITYCRFLDENSPRNDAEKDLKEKYCYSRVWIMGGTQIYAAALEEDSELFRVDELYLTHVKYNADKADAYLPAHKDFVIKEYARYNADDNNKKPYTFLRMVRSTELHA